MKRKNIIKLIGCKAIYKSKFGETVIEIADVLILNNRMSKIVSTNGVEYRPHELEIQKQPETKPVIILQKEDSVQNRWDALKGALFNAISSLRDEAARDNKTSEQTKEEMVHIQTYIVDTIRPEDDPGYGMSVEQDCGRV